MKIEARLAVAEGQGGKSVEILEEVVKLEPLDGDALMLLAHHYGNTGEKERAILHYQRAEGVEAFEADASVKHAQLVAGMGKVDLAIPLLKRAQQLKPRDSVGKFLEELERYQKQRR
jgi:Flp pilus assembly protein TadD